jgi:hypothetical protein
VRGGAAQADLDPGRMKGAAEARRPAVRTENSPAPN